MDAMGKPRLLDLFCCEGGAATGYARAGFEVVGVDIKPQPRYPFAFIQAAALDVRFGGFDAIHASPPCQRLSDLAKRNGNADAWPDLVEPIRRKLIASGLPYIIENVEAARWAMRDPVMLCGTMFGLGYDGHELQRHRLFESNITLAMPVCQHSGGPVIGVYGGHARCRSAKAGGRGTKDVWKGGHKVAASEAMGIDWMTLGDLSEAIPPAYTEYLGSQLIAHIRGMG